jgi:hypothetical protein
MMTQTYPSESLADSGVLAAKFLALILGGALFAWRYFTLNNRLAVGGVYIAALLVMSTPSVWPWDFLGQIRFGKSNSGESKTVSVNLSSPELRALPAGKTLSQITGTIDVPLLAHGEILIPQRLERVKVKDRRLNPVDAMLVTRTSRKGGSLASIGTCGVGGLPRSIEITRRSNKSTCQYRIVHTTRIADEG